MEQYNKMDRLIIRHGLSEANNRNNLGTLAFASKDAPLMPKGIEQAQKLGVVLRQKYPADTLDTAIACSELLRAQQTAQEAGFSQIIPYSILNEVEHGMDLKSLRSMLDSGELPQSALDTAETILESPPREGIIFTHGLVIAGLTEVLGLSQNYGRLIPRFCEVREISFD